MIDWERTHVCPICGKTQSRAEMGFSCDCHGIQYRLVCFDCLDKIIDGKGYDGCYYDETEECIDEYY